MPRLVPRYTCTGANRFPSIAAPTPRGTVAFGAGRTLALWDPRDGRGVYQTLTGHTAQVSCVKSVPGRDVLVSGDEGGCVNLWTRQDSPGGLGPAPEYTVAHSVQAHTASVSALGLVVHDDHILVLTGGSDALVHVFHWTPTALVKRQTLDLAGKLPLDMALHSLPGSKDVLLALATTERKVHIYTCTSEFSYALVLEGHEDWIRALDVTTYPGAGGEGDDLMLASASQDGYIRLWRITRLSSPLDPTPAPAPAPAPTADLDADMLDDFERRMTGDASGTSRTTLSTKAHLLRLPSSAYGINLDALLIGHEGWVTNVHWSPRSLSPESAPRLLTTSADNSMIIWAPDRGAAVWIAQHRFGDLSARGIGLFAALWVPDTDRASSHVDVLANGWNGGWHRWTARVDPAAPEEEDWVAGWAPTGHAAAVKDLAWDPAKEYLVSVRYVPPSPRPSHTRADPEPRAARTKRRVSTPRGPVPPPKERSPPGGRSTGPRYTGTT